MTVKTGGLDLAKDAFQVHGISENGHVIFNKAIKRAKLSAFFETLPPCTVGMRSLSRREPRLRNSSGPVAIMPPRERAPLGHARMPCRQRDTRLY